MDCEVQMAEARDEQFRLIHGYFSVNMERLWNTMQQYPPQLEEKLKEGKS